MDTSRSNRWTATLLAFSGRPDPTWEVSAADAAGLVRLWEAMEPTAGAATKPILGYRGVRLVGPTSRSWQALDGVVSRLGDGEEHRSDPDNLWEHTLLRTAPPDMNLPGELPTA